MKASTVDVYNKIVSYRISSQIIKQCCWQRLFLNSTKQQLAFSFEFANKQSCINFTCCQNLPVILE